MKTQQTIPSTWEELIFENRNQAYGAFAIRKSYSRIISEAVLASTLLVSMVLLGPRLISFVMGEKSTLTMIKKGDVYQLTPVPSLIPIVDRLKPSTASKMKRDLIPVVTTIVVPDPNIPPSTNSPSPGAETGSQAFPANGPTVAPGVEIAVTQPPPIVDYAEVMPNYQGGVKAMMKFIQKNMKYPARAKQIGTEGKVFIKFVVNYEGRVVNVEIVKGISDDCDKEAARVIAMLPNWTPGMQNRTPVSVRMILPIYFKLEN